ncbi:zinc finger BED domain-containing protein RICESLEEPER 2-like [Carya illinoinensis]|uniref:zinc finger BED domain-containing protein RICESLEEPER 2-like n=1 Tax=Carya illinoinensis TaxID=32201 RepID=UPI001C720ACA|nr:zinc finger BED domain-containing protein RICESLEEPER 2-like [Carya illinoinensis]
MLCLDVPTQWNSTYIMLAVAQKYERVFQRMEVEDGGLRYALMESTGGRRELGAPDAVDWDRVKSFIDFLKLFYDTTMRISGFKYCTANLYFNKLSRIHDHLQQNYVNKKAEEFIREPRKDIDDLYGHYNNNSHPTPASGSRSSSHSTSSTSSGDYTASAAALSSPLVQRYHQRCASRNIMQCRSEVEHYLMEDVEAPSDAFQLLTWWKHLTLDAYRSSLSASTVEALICIQKWLCEMPIRVDIIDPENYRLESDLLVNPSIVADE